MRTACDAEAASLHQLRTTLYQLSSIHYSQSGKDSASFQRATTGHRRYISSALPSTNYHLSTILKAERIPILPSNVRRRGGVATPASRCPLSIANNTFRVFRGYSQPSTHNAQLSTHQIVNRNRSIVNSIIYHLPTTIVNKTKGFAGEAKPFEPPYLTRISLRVRR